MQRERVCVCVCVCVCVRVELGLSYGQTLTQRPRRRFDRSREPVLVLRRVCGSGPITGLAAASPQRKVIIFGSRMSGPYGGRKEGPQRGNWSVNPLALCQRPTITKPNVWLKMFRLIFCQYSLSYLSVHCGALCIKVYQIINIVEWVYVCVAFVCVVGRMCLCFICVLWWCVCMFYAEWLFWL